MMQLIRAYEERMLELRAAREVIGPVHPYIGEEAVAAGVGQVLVETDLIVTNYRSHGHALAKGASLERLTAELFGRGTGVCGGVAAGHFCDPTSGILLASGIVGGGIPVGAGAAMSAQVQQSGQVVLCFLGDGAMGAGVVHEVLNVASSQRLPLVFVCENNLYQSATRTELVQPDVDLRRVAAGHLMPAHDVDGNDVEQVIVSVTDAVDRARGGEGPTFLQTNTYLTRFHIQFDVPSTEGRPADELARWLERDPIETGARWAMRLGADPAELAGIAADVGREIDEAVEWARSCEPAEAELWSASGPRSESVPARAIRANGGGAHG